MTRKLDPARVIWLSGLTDMQCVATQKPAIRGRIVLTCARRTVSSVLLHAHPVHLTTDSLFSADQPENWLISSRFRAGYRSGRVNVSHRRNSLLSSVIHSSQRPSLSVACHGIVGLFTIAILHVLSAFFSPDSKYSFPIIVTYSKSDSVLQVFASFLGP